MTTSPRKPGPKGPGANGRASPGGNASQDSFILNRDRHGRPTLFEDIGEATHETWDLVQDLRHVDSIARRAYVDRNALAWPLRLRREIRAEVRPLFRAAIRRAASSRDARLRGDTHAYETELLRARTYLLSAAIVARNSVINDRARSQSQNAKKPRKRFKSADDDVNIAAIVRSLAAQADALGDWIPARDLWTELYSRLDEVATGLIDDKTPGNECYHYEDGRGKPSSYKFQTFKSMVSQVRRKL